MFERITKAIRFRGARVAAPSLVAALAGIAFGRGQAPASSGQPRIEVVPRTATPRPVEPYDVTGRTFAGVPWPLPVTDGELKFAAQRVSAWTESETVSG